METLLKLILNDLPFYSISTIIILGALGVVLEKSIVRAGFSLVVCFGSVAGVYFLLQAPFVGASQVLIYAVGITLVVVFALMLTSLKHEPPKEKGKLLHSIFSVLVSIGIFATLSLVLTGNKWIETTNIATCPKNTEVIGLELLGPYVLPFELVSVLLLVALIGAVVIAKKDKKGV